MTHSPSLTIRLATAGDIEAIATLEKQYYGDEGYPLGFIFQAFRQWPEGLWVAQTAQGIVGYALVAPGNRAPRNMPDGQIPTPNSQNNEPWIMALLVAHEGRGKGIGRKICQAIIEHYQDIVGASGLWLSVAADNTAAVRLYRQLGFCDERMEKDFLGPGEDRVLMRKLMPN